ncbi:DEAD/DEAH box helicase family protein, partial [Streptomyces scabiei]|uniref:DEAD/DEAH box helicase family protein n=1 Tax=Streptomyces scabiei TaxID=1930 RepID=UPI00131E448F
MATTPLELRPHQREAVSATTRVLGNHPRASVIAACGTGKTLIAARTTARIAPRGRVLVLLPTLDLLSQTIRSWRLAGRKGTTVAVCSQRQALDHEPLGADIPLTTNPAELNALTTTPRPGPVTVYATYASLPAVIAAHRDHRLPSWDLWWSSTRTCPGDLGHRLSAAGSSQTGRWAGGRVGSAGEVPQGDQTAAASRAR